MSHMKDAAIAIWFGSALAAQSVPHMLAADQISPILNLVLAIVGAILGWLASKKKPE